MAVTTYQYTPEDWNNSVTITNGAGTSSSTVSYWCSSCWQWPCSCHRHYVPYVANSTHDKKPIKLTNHELNKLILVAEENPTIKSIIKKIAPFIEVEIKV